MIIPGIIASSRLVASTAFESIATYSPTSGTSVTFSSIPSTFSSLQVRYSIVTAGAGSLTFTWNGLTSNYIQHYLAGSGSAASASGSTARSSLDINILGGSSATYPYSGIMDFHDYASTTNTKVVRQLMGKDINGAGGEVALISGMNTSTAAISSLTFTTNNTFAAGSVIALYGIKGA